MDESFAHKILETAIAEHRCAALIDCLFDGGSVTLTPWREKGPPVSLVLIPGAAVKKLTAAKDGTP